MDNELNEQNNFIMYTTDDGQVDIEVRLEDENVWLTQNSMAELFDTTKQNISLHIKNIFEEKELEEYLEKGIQDEILLPVKKGRQVIFDMVKNGICIIYKFKSKEEEEVMQKLYDLKTGEGQKS